MIRAFSVSFSGLCSVVRNEIWPFFTKASLVSPHHATSSCVYFFSDVDPKIARHAVLPLLSDFVFQMFKSFFKSVQKKNGTRLNQEQVLAP